MNFGRSLRCLVAEYKTRQLHLAEGIGSVRERDPGRTGPSTSSGEDSNSGLSTASSTASLPAVPPSVFVADAKTDILRAFDSRDRMTFRTMWDSRLPERFRHSDV